jgi:hypothetical protein
MKSIPNGDITEVILGRIECKKGGKRERWKYKMILGRDEKGII